MREEVDRWHKGMRDRPGAANRALALLSKALNLAEVWGWRPDGSNPVRRVVRFHESDGAERFLSSAEMAALGNALRGYLADGGSLFAVSAIRLLALTGARRGEVLSLRWAYVDFEGARLNLPDSKTRKKSIPLNAAALALLQELPRLAGNPHVFPGPGASGHIVDLKKPWASIRARAGLRDVRLHDLRHWGADVERMGRVRGPGAAGLYPRQARSIRSGCWRTCRNVASDQDRLGIDRPGLVGARPARWRGSTLVLSTACILGSPKADPVLG